MSPMRRKPEVSMPGQWASATARKKGRRGPMNFAATPVLRMRVARDRNEENGNAPALRQDHGRDRRQPRRGTANRRGGYRARGTGAGGGAPAAAAPSTCD